MRLVRGDYIEEPCDPYAPSPDFVKICPYLEALERSNIESFERRKWKRWEGPIIFTFVYNLFVDFANWCFVGSRNYFQEFENAIHSSEVSHAQKVALPFFLAAHLRMTGQPLRPGYLDTYHSHILGGDSSRYQSVAVMAKFAQQSTLSSGEKKVLGQYRDFVEEFFENRYCRLLHIMKDSKVSFERRVCELYQVTCVNPQKKGEVFGSCFNLCSEEEKDQLSLNRNKLKYFITKRGLLEAMLAYHETEQAETVRWFYDQLKPQAKEELKGGSQDFDPLGSKTKEALKKMLKTGG